MELPNYHYTKDHEWVHIDAESNVVTIGITDYAQDKLGDVVHVELPELDSQFKTDDSFGSVESVKAVSDIYTPVAGQVIEINQSLEDTPELINDDPYGEGWMIKLRFNDGQSFDDLMSADAYQAYIAAQAH